MLVVDYNARIFENGEISSVGHPSLSRHKRTTTGKRPKSLTQYMPMVMLVDTIFVSFTVFLMNAHQFYWKNKFLGMPHKKTVFFRLMRRVAQSIREKIVEEKYVPVNWQDRLTV